MIHVALGGTLAAAAHHRNYAASVWIGLVTGAGLIVAAGVIALVNRRRAAGTPNPAMPGQRGGARRLSLPTIAIIGALLTALNAAVLIFLLR